MNIVDQYLTRAEETIQEAELMLQNNHFRAAVSRAYYASFYAVQAALEHIQVSAKSHQGAITMFSKHFIKTQILPRHYGRFLQNNLDQRLVGDYEIGFKAEKIDAQTAIDYAKEIYEGIKQYLQSVRDVQLF